MPAETNVTSMQQVEDQMRQGYSELAVLYQRNFEATMAAAQAMLSGVQTFNAEMLAFLQSRMKDGLATSQRLAECDSPQTALELQLEYGKTLVQAYTDEFEKLAQLSGKIMSESFAPLKGRADAVVGRAASNLAA